MILTKYEYLNRTLAIIDSCQTDCKIDFSFNLPKEFYDLTNPENEKGRSVSKHIDDKFHFYHTMEKKESLLKDLALNFHDGEICHYRFFKGEIKIGEGFDHCEINFLNPEYFNLTKQHKEVLAEVDVIFKAKID